MVSGFTSHFEKSQHSIFFSITELYLAVIPTKTFESYFVFDSDKRNNAGRHDANVLQYYWNLQFVGIQFSEQLTVGLKTTLVRNFHSQLLDFDERASVTCVANPMQRI